MNHKISKQTEPWLFTCGVDGCNNEVYKFDHHFPYFYSHNRCKTCYEKDKNLDSFWKEKQNETK